MGSLIELNGVRGIFLASAEFDKLALLLEDLASFADGEMILGRYVDSDDPIVENVVNARVELLYGNVDFPKVDI